jgi:phosphoribosylformylglycinamidine synthase
MATPRAIVLRAPGANCDEEAAFALRTAGAGVDRVHARAVREDPRCLRRYQILIIPGGFSYGDDVAAGKVVALQLQHFLADALRQFRDDEKLILGVCNGFQALLKAGLLVPPDEDGPLATLGLNDTGRFGDRWVELEVTPGRCPFLTGIERMHVPVAHGEGKFVARKEWILRGLAQSGQVVLRYAPGRNPNGSHGDVAGVCDATGRVLGLMPHPERHVLPTQHPQWTRQGLQPEGDGLKLFRNAVEFFQK